ncbi:MAG TPA: hypothetical protein VNO23_01015 [Candidatus Binatia bacterium]|nr:hypothetical protein [Candidatus Binatia bacterium]
MTPLILTQSAPRSALLFKPDRPRAIDRYIDYFGGAGPAEAQAASSWTRDDERAEPAP